MKITTQKVGHDEYYAKFSPGHPASLSVQGTGKSRSAAIADLRRQHREFLDDARQCSADYRAADRACRQDDAVAEQALEEAIRDVGRHPQAVKIALDHMELTENVRRKAKAMI